MILGTVQLGLEYGIGNTAGKPSDENAFALLDYAYHNGVSILDTAQAYGDSEKIIGRYHERMGNHFQICTKLPVEMSNITVQEAIQKSMNHLSVPVIDTCYLHRFEQCNNEQIILELQKAKEQKIITRIGISIYEPKELEYILKHFKGIIDVIQLPFNVVVKGYWSEELLENAHDVFTLYARSIFLQGLLLMPPDHPKVKAVQGEVTLRQLNDLALELGTDVKSLAWNFIQYHPFIDDFLVGCETIEQIKENIIFNQMEDKDYYNKLQSVTFTINEQMIDPRRWQQ